jgi:hypothetical protein
VALVDCDIRPVILLQDGSPQPKLPLVHQVVQQDDVRMLQWLVDYCGFPVDVSFDVSECPFRPSHESLSS